MTSVDTTTGLVVAPGFGFGARLAAVEDLVATWDLEGAQAAARALLDEPGLPPGDRLTARRLLAEALRELGELDAAYDLAEAVVTQAEQVYGPTHVATVHAWAVLAAVRHDYDEWDAAEALYHRVLDSGVDETDPVTGPEAARVIRLTRVNLALLQRDRGQRPLALAMLNAAYVVHRREYGADDLDTIRIAAELAALHHADGNVPASRRLFTLAHAAARSRLGNRHPFTKAVEWELAAVEPPMPASLVHPVPATGPAASAPAASPADATGATEDSEGSDDLVDPDDPFDLSAPFDPADSFDPADPADLDELGGPDGGPGGPGPVGSPAGAVPVGGPAEVVAAGPVVQEAAMRHPGGADAAVVGERRVVVPLKAVAGVVVGALLVAAVSVFWPSGGAPSSGAADGAGSTGVTTVGAGADAGGEPVRVHDLRLRDDGATLAVTWAALQSRAVVALSRAGEPAVVVAEVPPGTTSYVVKGVDPVAAYCVVVGPVDAAVAVTAGTSVCTARP
ncbi:tetratricopeptide repeat protein [Dactylosporangium sp. NPDC050688]|uniref:tetratricopeptide repeat protein n=1 Tax=Dactylosporangium sp. NPDC050688 TaxID=3157217 RepID=UPI0033C0FFBC